MLIEVKMAVVAVLTALVLVLVPAAGAQSVELYDNGGIFTGTTVGGVASPGNGWSEVQAGNTIFGFGATYNANRLADDFVVPDGEVWSVTSFDVFAYLSGGAGAPFTGGYLRLWRGSPEDPLSQVVAGDMTTNRLLSSTATGVYRTSAPANTARHIFRNTIGLGSTVGLPAGHYWIEWATAAAGGSNNFHVPVTIPGQLGKPGANARQYVSSAWNAVVDPGSSTAQDMAFAVTGVQGLTAEGDFDFGLTRGVPGARTVTISNNTAVTFAGLDVGVDGPYSVSDDCPTDLAASASCDIVVTPDPAAAVNASHPAVMTVSAGGNSTLELDVTWTHLPAEPVAPVITGPTGVITSHDADFDVTAGELGQELECALDDDNFGACPPDFAYTGLDSGVHTFKVRGTSLDDAITNATREFTIDDAPVNSVPSSELSTSEDSPYEFADEQVSVSDLDTDAVTVTLDAGRGTFAAEAVGSAVVEVDDDTGRITVTGPQADVNATLNGLVYTPNADANGADTIVVTTSDQLLGDEDEFTIQVSPVNDAPVNSVPPEGYTVQEDTEISFAGLGVEDVDQDTLTVTLEASAGTMQLDSDTLSVTGNGTGTLAATGSVGDLNASLSSISYAPDANDDGTVTVTMTTTNGLLGDEDQFTIQITPKNDAPVNTVPVLALGAEEDTPYSFSPGQVSVSDVDSDTLSVTLSIATGTLAFNTSAGLTVNGSGTGDLSATGSRADLNAALGSLVYTPADDVTGGFNVKLTTTDESSGSDEDTFTFEINPVNDAPANTVPASLTTPENTTVALSGVSVADVDAGGQPVTVVLTPAHGSLTLTAVAPINVDSDSGKLTFTGTLAEVNTTLSMIAFDPETGYVGTEAIRAHRDGRPRQHRRRRRPDGRRHDPDHGHERPTGGSCRDADARDGGHHDRRQHRGHDHRHERRAG